MQDNQIQVISLNDLNASKVKQIIERSFDGELKLMDDETVCLFDISAYQVDRWRSLIIQSNGKIYYSLKTTKEILHTFSTFLNSFHEVTCKIAELLDYTQKIPYVVGERCIIPLDGYSKKPVTWVVSTKFRAESYNSSTKVLSLYTSEQHVLNLSIKNKRSFDEQNHRAYTIHQHKMAVIVDMLKPYANTYRKRHVVQSNIVAERANAVPYLYQKLNYYDIVLGIIHDSITRYRKKLINEGYLLDDDDFEY